ncbi:MAG: hypothetical protein WDM81_19680 [Rhizomicrobium sp.]
MPPRKVSSRPVLLVTMGGSDPLGLTLRSARALAKLDPGFRARFVIGPGIAERRAVARQIVALNRNFETIEGADDLATEFAGADLALAAFGVTAYELAAGRRAGALSLPDRRSRCLGVGLRASRHGCLARCRRKCRRRRDRTTCVEDARRCRQAARDAGGRADDHRRPWCVAHRDRPGAGARSPP